MTAFRDLAHLRYVMLFLTKTLMKMSKGLRCGRKPFESKSFGFSFNQLRHTLTGKFFNRNVLMEKISKQIRFQCSINLHCRTREKFNQLPNVFPFKELVKVANND
ncbi:CLUMA_CG021668, isoform A [Clunio marinus]|uniref:CLUMA_CG021668, isoform A n=1 Tax=Clunio marinus TaxID=568069 RepID=A0A1J1J832_9DIPT|nr:CLUMA_CG021668, isoform A [Clunio marinus]